MANEVAVKKEGSVTRFSKFIEGDSAKGIIQQAAGANQQLFMSNMIAIVANNEQLQECVPREVLTACLEATALNLSLSKVTGQSYIVVYKDREGNPHPQFQIGYLGLWQLALRSGQFKHFNPEKVYEGEQVVYQKKKGVYDILGEPKSDKVIGYFAYFETHTGFEKMVYMTVSEIEAHAKKYSKSQYKGNLTGAWKSSFHEMALKTVTKKVLKFGPQSTTTIDLYTAIDADDLVEQQPPNEPEVVDLTPTGAGASAGVDDSMPWDGDVIEGEVMNG